MADPESPHTVRVKPLSPESHPAPFLLSLAQGVEAFARCLSRDKDARQPSERDYRRDTKYCLGVSTL